MRAPLGAPGGVYDDDGPRFRPPRWQALRFSALPANRNDAPLVGPTAANLPSAELPAAGLSAGGRSPVAARAPCACVPFSNTMQVSRPVAKAPVSMLMRLGRISGSATGVWPCTTILPKSARLLRNSPRIHSKSCSLCRSRGIPGRTPASRARSPRSHFEQIEAPVDVADRVDE
jgi:hypothetical protein